MAFKYLNDEFDNYDNENTCNYNNIAQLMDQSTQIAIDEPILIESTFNTSSCSNLSDDLIILQTALPIKSTTNKNIFAFSSNIFIKIL